MSPLERRARHFVLFAFVASIAIGQLLVGCDGDAEDPSTGTGGAEAGQGGTGAGGKGGSAGSAIQAGEGGNAGEGGSGASGGTVGSGGSAGTSSSGGTSGAGGQPGDGGSGGGGIDIAECRDCIAESAELGPVQAEYCEVSTECIAVQNCVLEADCYVPIPATCYCGADIDNCENADFIPTGPCVDEIRAGAGDPADNATVLERFFDFNFPTGVGMQIVNEASRSCKATCFP